MNFTLPRALKSFVDEQIAGGRYTDASDVVGAALRRMQDRTGFSGGAIGDGDIMALAFMAMMEAAKSAQEDLKAIMDGVKAINKAKDAWRALLSQVGRDVAANANCRIEKQRLDFSRGLGTERAYHRVAVPCLDHDAPGGVRSERVDLYRGKIENAEDLKAIYDDLKGRLDSMSDMGEMEMLRMQMAMDRYSKVMEALSNMLKKASDTSSTIIQNIN